MNRDGLGLSNETIQQLGSSYSVNPDRILALNQSIVDQYSAETGISRAPLVDRLKLWLSSHYEFRRNTLTDLISMRRLSSSQWLQVNTATLWVEMNSDNRSIGKGKKGGDITISKSDIENIIDSDFVPEFDPILNYFESLPAWDEKTDHIRSLASHIVVDDQEFWLEQFSMALVRSIACWRGDLVNRIIMTLIGELEETGKSSFIRFLCPPQLKEYYKEDPMVHDKDGYLALCENFIWNLEELDELDRKEVSSMKAIISQEVVKQRRSYARYPSRMRRIVNFWASTNKNDILSDIKNTRWLCFNVLSVNHDYNNLLTGVKNVDIDKVWAQAWHLYKAGSRFVLTS
ncbi:MAG TPA: VapE domain-containing protein, partial [Terriglobia bacterium]|nr:VapE domain-containing protein [Terriglobia bacterium]